VKVWSSSGEVYFEVCEMKRPRKITASAKPAFSIPIPFMISSPIKFSRIAAYSGTIFIGGMVVCTSNSEEAAVKADKSRSEPVRDNCTSAAVVGSSLSIAPFSTSGFVTTDINSSGVILMSRARAYGRQIVQDMRNIRLTTI
jgi:hypothetical protein